MQTRKGRGGAAAGEGGRWVERLADVVVKTAELRVLNF